MTPVSADSASSSADGVIRPGSIIGYGPRLGGVGGIVSAIGMWRLRLGWLYISGWLSWLASQLSLASQPVRNVGLGNVVSWLYQLAPAANQRPLSAVIISPAMAGPISLGVSCGSWQLSAIVA